MEMETMKAKIGDWLECDGWRGGAELQEDDGFKDSSFPGCQFRVKMRDMMMIAVNVTVTGNRRLKYGRWASRCKVEFVGDGEPSVFAGGWIYHV